MRKDSERTRVNARAILNIAINYGGRQEIIDAIRELANEGVDLRQLEDATLASHLYTRGLPDPDLVVRTAGEMRLSNFLLWQTAYSEFYSTQTLWPDFADADFDEAIASYQRRVRRFCARPEEVPHRGRLPPGCCRRARPWPAGVRTRLAGEPAPLGPRRRGKPLPGVHAELLPVALLLTSPRSQSPGLRLCDRRIRRDLGGRYGRHGHRPPLRPAPILFPHQPQEDRGRGGRGTARQHGVLRHRRPLPQRQLSTQPHPRAADRRLCRGRRPGGIADQTHRRSQGCQSADPRSWWRPRPY